MEFVACRDGGCTGWGAWMGGRGGGGGRDGNIALSVARMCAIVSGCPIAYVGERDEVSLQTV